MYLTLGVVLLQVGFGRVGDYFWAFETQGTCRQSYL